MAAAQPAQFGAPGDDITDWMVQRWRAVANLGPEAEAAGRRLWAQATRSGQDLAASNPSDLKALGAQSLKRAQPNPVASRQRADPSQTFVPSADAPTRAALRQQQAQLGQVRNHLSIQNSPYAVPALLPAALLALDVPAALGIRGLLSRPTSGALAFPELDAWQVRPPTEAPTTPSAANSRNSFPYAAGRARLARANGISASDMDAQAHHSLSVQYSENFPNADPNRLANLWALKPEAHQIATNMWAQFSRNLAGRAPSQAEIMAQKLKVDREVAPYIRRAGVPRSNNPKGGLY
jgi:hypothetical protein